MAQLKVLQIFIFICVWVLYGATYLVRKPLGAIKVGMKEELGFSQVQLGFLDTAMLLPYSLAQMVLGSIADHMGPRRTVAICLGIAGISMFSFGSWDNFGILLVLIFINGAAQGPVWPACCKCVSAWFSDHQLNSMFGLINTSAYGGSIIASGLAAYLYSEYGWRFVYCPLSVVVMMLAVVAWLMLKMPKEYKVIIPGKEPIEGKKASYNKMNSFFALWRLPMVLELAVAMFCNKVVRYFIYLWFPVYLMKELSYSAANTGLLVSLFDVGGILGSVFLGMAADRYNSLVLTLLATVTGAAGFLFFKFTAAWGMTYNSIMLSVGGACVCGIDALLGGSVAVKIGEKGGGNGGAAVAGLINGFGSMGAVIQGPLIGFMSDMYGWNSVFSLVEGLLLLSSFLILKAIYIERRQVIINNITQVESGITVH